MGPLARAVRKSSGLNVEDKHRWGKVNFQFAGHSSGIANAAFQVDCPHAAPALVVALTPGCADL